MTVTTLPSAGAASTQSGIGNDVLLPVGALLVALAAGLALRRKPA
jgi:hypothetical protein